MKAGEVTLEGSVDSKHMKRMAEDVAEEVSGVRDVQNRLKVERDTARQSESYAGQSSSWPNKK